MADKTRETTQKEFKQFKTTFTQYQQMFGLSGYEIYFKFEPLDCAFATISVREEDMVATVTLTSETSEKDLAFLDVEKSAKHEAIHLLLARMAYLVCKREYSGDDEREAEEEAVNRLIKLLP